jgi:hypothetical protein
MRRLLLAAVLAASVLAVVAAPSLARRAAKPPVSHKFTGSESAEPRFTGATEQEFVLKPFTIDCETAKGTKTGIAPTFPTESLLASVKYSGCTATVALKGMEELELKAKFRTPVDLNINANGYLETGSGGTVTDGKLEGASDIEIAIGGPFKCTIDIEPGTFPAKAATKPAEMYEAAKFTPEEAKIEKGKKVLTKDSLGVALALSKMAYDFEGEFCEAFRKTEGTNGTYAGSLHAELSKGSLGWE